MHTMNIRNSHEDYNSDLLQVREVITATQMQSVNLRALFDELYALSACVEDPHIVLANAKTGATLLHHAVNKNDLTNNTYHSCSNFVWDDACHFHSAV